MPTIDFGMVIGPAKKDEGGADWLVAAVVKTSPAKQQLAQLPPGLEKDIGTLQGTEIRIQVTADGRESELRTELSKNSKAELARVKGPIGVRVWYDDGRVGTRIMEP